MPVDNRSFEEIREQDMRVFEKLILAGKVDALKPAHVIYSAVDDKPAGFSPIWIQQVLRQQLGFDGVVFSDDLSMQAASVAGSINERAEQALNAGCDMVLVCNSPSEAEKVLDGLHQNKPYSKRWLQLLNSEIAKAKAITVQAHLRKEYASSVSIINNANEQFS